MGAQMRYFSPGSSPSSGVVHSFMAPKPSSVGEQGTERHVPTYFLPYDS